MTDTNEFAPSQPGQPAEPAKLDSAQLDSALADSAATAELDSAASANEQTAKRWRLGRNKLIALGAAILLVGGGGAWAYNVYQAPSTVIGMAIGSLFGQKNPAVDIKVLVKSTAISGDLTVKASTGDAGADLNALLNLDLAGLKASANIESIAAKSGDVYLQLSKIDSLISLVSSTIPGAGMYKTLAQNISGKWIKLSKAEIEQYVGPASKDATCIQDKYKDSSHAEAVKSEIVNLATTRQFFVIDKNLGTKNGSVGYQMGIDVTQLKAFLTQFLDTKAFADYESCAGGSASNFSKSEAVKSINSLTAEDVKNALSGTKISIWADQWSHKLTELSVVTKQTGITIEADLMPIGDRSSQIKIPADSISVSDLAGLLSAK
jgi:hypothetical protein